MEGLFIPMFQQTVLGDNALWEDCWCLCLRSLLTPDCDSDLYLFSPAEYVTLTIFVISAMVTYLNVQISRLACAMTKAFNATSQAISVIVKN